MLADIRCSSNFASLAIYSNAKHGKCLKIMPQSTGFIEILETTNKKKLIVWISNSDLP